MSEPSENNVKCTKNIDFYKFPGQKCNDPALCLGTLKDGYCRGKSSGAACTGHSECDVGLRCGLSLTCEPAALEGEYCDENHLLCESYLACKESTCVRYGSIPNDYSPGKAGEDLCESHHVDKSGVCRAGHKLIGPIIVDTNEHKCVYDNTEENYAVCAYHKDGKAICKPGDAELYPDWKAVTIISLLTNSYSFSPIST